MGKALPRGIRLNNPTNIRHGDPWWGRANDQPDPEFVKFVTPEFGIRASAKNLLTYQRKGFRTIEAIISRWAPKKGDRNGPLPGGEYTQDTGAYITAVERATGFRRNLVLKLNEARYMKPLLVALINHENGRPPKGGWYSDAVIDEGLRLAGVK